MSVWRFPTLADVPRDQWPATLKVRPPDPAIGGDVERIYCGCKCFHPADEIFDLRSVPTAWQTTNGLTLPAFTCSHCFHHRLMLRQFTWGGIARAMGCADAAALASFDATDAAPTG